MSDEHYEYHDVEGGVGIKSWTRGVEIEKQALKQLQNVAKIPFVFKHVAVMPDVHWTAMTDLDAKIRAKLSPVYDPPWAMKQYRAALTAVLDRHQPVPGVRPGELVCSCLPDSDDLYVAWPYPCPTKIDIARALGIEVPNDQP